jgi:hypothetical protein
LANQPITLAQRRRALHRWATRSRARGAAVKPSRSRLIALFIVACATALVFLVWPKGSRATAEELIRRQVVQMARAAEDKDIGEITKHISDRFQFEEGGKRELQQLLAAQILRGNWLRVFVVGVDVRVTSGTTAGLSGKFIFGRSKATTLKELSKQSELSSYAIDAQLEKEGDDWKIVSARRRAIDPAEFL